MRVEVKGQIAEVKIDVYLCNLTSNL